MLVCMHACFHTSVRMYTCHKHVCGTKLDQVSTFALIVTVHSSYIHSFICMYKLQEIIDLVSRLSKMCSDAIATILDKHMTIESSGNL